MPIDISAFPPLLRLEQVGEHRYEGKPEYEGEVVRNVVFGGQVLAQAIVAAHIDRNEDRVEGTDHTADYSRIM